MIFTIQCHYECSDLAGCQSGSSCYHKQKRANWRIGSSEMDRLPEWLRMIGRRMHLRTLTKSRKAVTGLKFISQKSALAERQRSLALARNVLAVAYLKSFQLFISCINYTRSQPKTFFQRQLQSLSTYRYSSVLVRDPRTRSDASNCFLSMLRAVLIETS